MPKVVYKGKNKHFSYDAKGRKSAKRFAKKTGGKMMMTKHMMKGMK